ncbi:MutL-like protein 1, colon cancer, nonpolyposis type 2 [Hesseltinella vesiculosa]|uniref:MutL-like protein 1, colon cancer, nonpolyposis type 2 n=1 Tax=Hesseltinella vesiculosa TaxID=101127 RepID=A0A1X2GYR0_9FUNG|nr:MutL-like protein 1, colon cancer, nonpolyposis type 2 [Hesseltinella vesiculosa]
MSTPSIRRLDTSVVNRIAAGEVIHRPANALKELLENCLDAGASQIQITVKEGGLKFLQIQDNGHGIKKEDLAIVCERFTTSKLKQFDDLSRIVTYGFRGEALASISHVAHLTITTKTADSPCAYRAAYVDGQLSAPAGQNSDPKPCAGNNGTQITVEDLFYNMPTRKKALRSPSDEYNRIVDVVSRYAIHNHGVSFSCKKVGTMTGEVQTNTNTSTLDNIRQIYGTSVSSELLFCEAEAEALNYSMKAYISNANYSMKRTTLLLFINNRLVESDSIKRMVDTVYTSLLPKGGHPFVYLSLMIKPENIDVNVHPTKQKVHFLNEDHVVEAIQEEFLKILENANDSRTFYTQTLLPGATSTNTDRRLSQNIGSKAAVYHQVRTDSRATTLDTFVLQPLSTPTSAIIDVDEDTPMAECNQDPASMDVDQPTQPINKVQKNRKERVQVTLTSVLELRKKIRRSEHPGMTALLAGHTFVGCIDDSMALIQHDTSLYMVNYASISEELFYQIILSEFNNFGTIDLSSPIPIGDCIGLAIDAEAAQGLLPPVLRKKDLVIQKIVDKVLEFSDMLQDYFALSVSSKGELLTLPMLIQGYLPTMDKLPMFFLRLGTEVDWEDEQRCLDGLARELAVLFAAEPPLPGDHDAGSDDYKTQHDKYLWQVQHLVFPALKTGFVTPKNIVQDGSSFVTQLARSSDLYKIFERC